MTASGWSECSRNTLHGPRHRRISAAAAALRPLSTASPDLLPTPADYGWTVAVAGFGRDSLL